MAHQSQQPLLEELLKDHLGAKTAQDLLVEFQKAKTSAPVLELLIEMGEVSSKIQGEAIRAMVELARAKSLTSVVSWLDLGIMLAQTTGALGLRYFKESPAILGFLNDQAQWDPLLTQVIEMADEGSEMSAHCAYEWFKVLPEISQRIALEELPDWATMGMRLAEWNYVLGNEFFRESPRIARALSLSHIQGWIGFGMKLVVQNQFGKPDYIGTLEFFRTSPQLFLEIPEDEIKQGVIELGSNLAEHSPEHAVSFLAESPRILQRLPSLEWKNRIIKYGLLVADRDPEATMSYFMRSPEVVQLAGDGEEPGPFGAWFAQGMEALEYSVEAGRAFFNLETHKACAAVEEAMSGVPLRQVSRSLHMFARALCGEDISIKGLAEREHSQDGAGALVKSTPTNRSLLSLGEKAIYLPMIMKRSSTRLGNQRWYTVMVAHEIGHIEFGTYRISDQVLQRVGMEVQGRYSRGAPLKTERIDSLGDLFPWYPQPRLIQDLWEILEDARVDFLLKHEYSGLKDDLQTLTKEALEIRTFTHGMTAREIILDALLLYFAGLTKNDFTRPGLQEIIDRSWSTAQKILHPKATVNDAVELADRLYQELDRHIGHYEEPSRDLESFPNTEASSDPLNPAEATEQMGDDYQPVDNLEYRGTMDPYQVQGVLEESDGQEQGQSHGAGTSSGAGRSGSGTSHQAGSPSPHSSSDSDSSPSSRFGESPMQQWFETPLPAPGDSSGERIKNGEFLYPEWDGRVRDYRPHWCRVIEQPGLEGSPDFVDETLQTYGPIIRLIRRYFETIRPEAFRRMRRQSDGEEIDIDALVEWTADRRHGNDSIDQIYSTRQKHDRQVAVSFVVDMSGSTGRQIGTRARPVIEIEKEGLLLLSEALSAIGDQFAIYGFSGQSRKHVDLHVLKDFQDRAGGRVGLKISGVQPRKQNRDGAVIRHATARLINQAAKVRLLVLISDGKPLDDEYGDEYSLEDTKMALREARQKGVHPFCVTIDQAPTDYVRRMYGDISYLVIDDVEALPTRLPRMYQRLTAR